MGYAVTTNTSICSNLKLTYFRIIVPFEEYVKRVKLAGGTIPPDPAKASEQEEPEGMKEYAEKLAQGTPRTLNGTGSPSEAGPSRSREPVETSERVRTASDKLNEALDFKPSSALAFTFLFFLRITVLTFPSSSARRTKADRRPGESCEICSSDHDPDFIVLCDECDRGYHLNCMNPPLKQVPTSQFYCDHCLLNNGADYGFEEGQDHSLFSFRRRADAFKRKWLQDHPLPLDKGKGRERDDGRSDDVWREQLEIEDHFEREFWRLVESPLETVEVESGADVQSTKDGAYVSFSLIPSLPPAHLVLLAAVSLTSKFTLSTHILATAGTSTTFLSSPVLCCGTSRAISRE
jgi:hypothetical protein